MADATAWISAPIHATASDWAARVVTNGGAAVSNNTLAAVSNFCGALDAAAIRSLMIAVNIIAPDNLIAATTPLIVDSGNDPWTNTAFVAADLTVQGLKANGSTKFLNTGVIPSVSFVVNTDGGLTAYNTFADVTASAGEMGSSTGATQDLVLYVDTSNTAVLDSYNSTTARVTSNTPLTFGLGFTSGNRVGANANIYAASSTQAFGSIGNVAAAGGTLPAIAIFTGALNQSGVAASFSRKRLSFAAIHHGLSSAQCQNLYNATQALRIALGGGWI